MSQQTGHVTGLSFLTPPALQDPQIVLTWLARLRWLAVIGQVAAILVSTLLLRLDLPLAPMAAVILLTALSNLLLQVWGARRVRAHWVIPIVVLLDVGLLTVLLYCAGGPDNPFGALYLIHVAMAAVVLPGLWTWIVAAAAAACYALLFWRHVPLAGSRTLSPEALAAGQWIAVALVALLIALFVGRIMQALRGREQELALAREQATRNDRLAALTTLAAGAAHELGTPLGTIALVAKELELAAQASGADAAVAEDARLIRQEVERCRAILDRMRVDVAADPSPQWGSLQLDELVRRVCEDLPLHEQDRLQIECAPGISTLWASLAAVRRALGVLLRNAFDATPAGERVSLSVDRRDGQVCFEVRDRGDGMSEDVLRRAGEPFFTTKPPGQGMGLGLFLARLVAEMHGGRLHIASRPGQGTCSVLELPAEREEQTT